MIESYAAQARLIIETDNISYEQFLADEAREMNSTDPARQNLSRCIQLADHILNNDSTIEELHRQVDNVLTSIASQNTQKVEKSLS